MSHRTAPGIVVQEPRPADCHHSKQPFAAAFYVINERRDISPVAKLVHAHLVTLHRTGRDATQAEIGDAIGCSRHQVWRAVGELVAADLVQTIRYGLGRPNGYVLLGLDQESLDGKSGRATASRPRQQAVAGHAGPRARVPSYPQEKLEEREKYRPKAEGPRQPPPPRDPRRAAMACLVCPGELHAPDACPATTPAAPVAPVGGPCAHCHVEHGPPECTAWMFGGRR